MAKTSNCAKCGKPTANPKFCDKSCAASFNNRSKPKRKPEGRCIGCGAAISASQRRCSGCKEVESQAARDRAENVVTIRRLDGAMERVNVVPTSLKTKTVVRPVHAEELSLSAPASKVFEILLGLLAHGPDWLRLEERARYTTLFRDLALFPVATHDSHPRAETLPIADLPRAASQWLDSLARSADPLLLSFGLDAHEFLFALLMGRSGYGDDPELEPVLQLRPTLEWSSFFNNRSLRRHYTERVLNGLLVVARVPENSSIRLNNDVLVNAGDPFGISILRCHLSEASPYEYADLDVDWPRIRPFDRASDFSFRSRLLVFRTPSGMLAPWTPGQVVIGERAVLQVPAHWITGILDRHADPLGDHPTAVRAWTA
jgi:predicted nucleic acid-binding Zn ribbon protein